MYWLTKLAKHKLVLTIVFTLVLGMMVAPAMAAPGGETDPADQEINFGLSYGADTGLGTSDVRKTVSDIINVTLSLLGIVAVVIILWGGFRWMTAGGNEESVSEARKIIFSGIIGLAIILSAYAVARFVLEQLYQATTGSEYTAENGLLD